MRLLEGLRMLAYQKRQTLALERIATCLEELLLRQGGGSGLRTYYRDNSPDGAAFLAQTDEDFAALEALERKKTDRGVDVPLDLDLEEEE